MTDRDLEKINLERRRKGLPPLTKTDAQVALLQHAKFDGSEFDSVGFLIGYTTGIPMPSTGGIIGALLHTESVAPATTNFQTPVERDPEPKILDGGIDGPYNEPDPAPSYAPAIEPSSNDSYSAPSTSESYSSPSSDTSYSSPSFE